ncbi:hypothetical protein [Chryseobacterium gambrini]|uniref:hypothetical protein n=1 Tax=Chryseobacterium gambrini TaxID=373672 RepID=UPI003BA59556
MQIESDRINAKVLAALRKDNVVHKLRFGNGNVIIIDDLKEVKPTKLKNAPLVLSTEDFNKLI